MVSDYRNFLENLHNATADSIINDEEYSSLNSNVTFGYLLNDIQPNTSLNDEAIKNLETSFYDSYQNQFSEIYYQTETNMYFYNIIFIILIVLYYVVFPLFTKGQTLGKKLFNYRLTNIDGSSAKWYQLLIRAIILYNVIPTIIYLFLISFVPKSNFTNILSYYYNGSDLIQIVIFMSIIIKPDHRGFHDLLAKTKLINAKESASATTLSNETSQIKEAKVLKETKTIKKAPDINKN